jgi:hypothetical protein
MESRPWWTFVPDQGLIVPDAVRTNVPGAGRYMFTAARAADGSCAMIYVPAGRRFSVNVKKVSGEKFRAWWFDPREGRAVKTGEFARGETMEFDPPNHGEGLDWVLVLDDVAKNYPVPGGSK